MPNSFQNFILETPHISIIFPKSLIKKISHIHPKKEKRKGTSMLVGRLIRTGMIYLLPKNILVLLNIFIYLFIIVSFELSQQLLTKYHFRKLKKNKNRITLVNRLAVHLLYWYVLYCGSFFFLLNTLFKIYMSKVVLSILREKVWILSSIKVCMKR